MNWEDSIIIRRTDKLKGSVTEQVVDGVWCIETDGIHTENSGFIKIGRIVVRIPLRIPVTVACGDEICCRSSLHWFTVTEVRNNHKSRTGLNHLKIIGER